MPYPTFAEQIASHIAFFRENDLAVSEEDVRIDAGFVRCRAIGQPEGRGRGEYSYRIERKSMDNPSMIGIVSWCRGRDGAKVYKTYGLDGDLHFSLAAKPAAVEIASAESPQAIIERCNDIWEQSDVSGEAPYLKAKGVGSYGLRFQQNSYGQVAIVPGRDHGGNLLTLQFLNPDGSKRFLKGTSLKGAFHMIDHPHQGGLIGIAESYATAASCHELTGFPVACAFSASNLKSVAIALSIRYPNNSFVLFADNDLHLVADIKLNEGLLKAQEAREAIGEAACLVTPNFGCLEPNKHASDWNDLVRLLGKDEAKRQIWRIHNS